MFKCITNLKIQIFLVCVLYCVLLRYVWREARLKILIYGIVFVSCYVDEGIVPKITKVTQSENKN